MHTSPLVKTIQILLLFFLVFAGLYIAKPFLVPLALAGIIAMLFLPLNRWMEKKGIGRGVSILLCILILVSVIIGILAILTWQIAGFTEDMSQMQAYISKMATNVAEMIQTKFGISLKKQQEILKQQQSSGAGGAGKMAMTVMSSSMSMMVDTVLVLVYIFLLMYSRNHLKQFILKLVPNEQKEKTLTIIHDGTKVAQQYLSGLAMMIGMLWVMYGIGFSIVGVENALFFAVICGLLEIVPFVGNITGTGLTLIGALSQGGDTAMIIGILLTYGTVQFLQTYILEPLVVGSQVKINPLFTIIVIVVGELVWGIPGMILAIPLVGIVKIIFDNVTALKPYGFLIGEEKKKNAGIIDKIKGWFNKS
ncbi:AI-2E family transporter [Runella sp.]|uniref:AI-2E family transporter n=1 Tax=Runella sp. TaxID=1960881 RepID=UPI003D0A4611